MCQKKNKKNSYFNLLDSNSNKNMFKLVNIIELTIIYSLSVTISLFIYNILLIVFGIQSMHLFILSSIILPIIYMIYK